MAKDFEMGYLLDFYGDEVIFMWLFYKTGFQKQLVCQLSGWIVYKWVCAITAHTHLFLCPLCG